MGLSFHLTLSGSVIMLQDLPAGYHLISALPILLQESKGAYTSSFSSLSRPLKEFWCRHAAKALNTSRSPPSPFFPSVS